MMNIKRTADVSSLWGAGCFGDEMDSHMPVIEVQFKLEKETSTTLADFEGYRIPKSVFL
jgi:hypothetical protein